MRRGNILMVANWESDVGYAWWLMENFWVSIAEHFSHKGVRSFLVYPKISCLPDTIDAADIEASELDLQDHSIGNLLKIRHYISRHDIRYLYLSDASTCSLFYVWLKLCGVHRIVIHDHTPGERSTPGAAVRVIKQLLNRLPLYSADHFIAVTAFVQQRLIDVNCVPQRSVSLARNGITPYDLQGVDTAYSHREFNIAEDRRIIVTTGRANVYKGIDFFIACANELVMQQGMDKLHFLFCGDGPDMETFRALVDAHRLDDHFTFAGKRSDIKQILPSCDIGMHCALGEVGYSLSILEYMSAGLATIVPDRASTRQATRDGETGLLYTPGDIDSATAAIKRALQPEFAATLSENAMRAVHDEFDIGLTNAALIRALDPVYV